MTFKISLDRLWDNRHRFRNLRIVSKEKLAKWKADREQALVEDRMICEAIRIQSGLIEEVEDKNNGFEYGDNPHGEGSSKSLENPSPTRLSDMDKNPPLLLLDSNGDYLRSSYATFPERLFKPDSWLGPESLRIDFAKGKRKGRARVDDSRELRLLREWLAQVEAGNVMLPEHQWTRDRILAVALQRAWTY